MMDSFVMYQVGTCDPGLAMRKDCCLLQFFEGIPHVYVLIDRPTEEMLQRANFEKATIEFGLFAHKDVMTLAIKVGDLRIPRISNMGRTCRCGMQKTFR